MKGKKKKHRTTEVPKRKYTEPRLVVHGDLRALTRAKAGIKNDGAAKPATRDTGGAA